MLKKLLFILFILFLIQFTIGFNVGYNRKPQANKEIRPQILNECLSHSGSTKACNCAADTILKLFSDNVSSFEMGLAFGINRMTFGYFNEEDFMAYKDTKSWINDEKTTAAIKKCY